MTTGRVGVWRILFAVLAAALFVERGAAAAEQQLSFAVPGVPRGTSPATGGRARARGGRLSPTPAGGRCAGRSRPSRGRCPRRAIPSVRRQQKGPPPPPPA